MGTLFPRPFQVIRNTRSLVRGVWTLGTPETLTFRGSIQAITGEALLAIEAGSRGVGKVWVYTGSMLQRRVEGSDAVSDVVLYDGYRWEIIDAIPYKNGIIPHRKYLAEYRGPE